METIADNTAGVSKQAGDRRSSTGYLIVCRRLLWSEQSARDTQSWHCFLSLRQHSSFTLNLAAIVHTQKDASVVQKTQIVCYILCRMHLSFSLSGRANLVWACDDVVAYFSSSGRFQLTA